MSCDWGSCGLDCARHQGCSTRHIYRSWRTLSTGWTLTVSMPYWTCIRTFFPANSVPMWVTLNQTQRLTVTRFQTSQGVIKEHTSIVCACYLRRSLLYTRSDLRKFQRHTNVIFGWAIRIHKQDGVPLWVINKSVPVHEFPWPLSGNCSRFWEDNIFAEASAKAYQVGCNIFWSPMCTVCLSSLCFSRNDAWLANSSRSEFGPSENTRLKT